VMFMRSELNAELPNQGHFFNAGKPGARFTPAGPDHAQIAAANGVVDYFETVYRHHFKQPASEAEQARAVRELFRSHEILLLQPLLDFMHGHPRIRLIGRRNAPERAPTVAFTVDGVASPELAALLSERKLGVGVGDFYAYRLVQELGIAKDEGALRASFVHYTSPEEVNRLIDALDQLL